ncbi:hypothetical protein [Leptospira ilyithenensis]|uniref:Putative phage tail fibre C-terminal domain-containing protein n=1 Tax=Leptospira ilyithenensis TaxID=2484901 RepID=A0A4R9LQ69_9LEPT|nr:hypothetical protein [Leptospira ilyithenensis]TGN09765.1 hypothetical protein EHS11_11830 [Leptospira ilyithenensis]
MAFLGGPGSPFYDAWFQSWADDPDYPPGDGRLTGVLGDYVGDTLTQAVWDVIQGLTEMGGSLSDLGTGVSNLSSGLTNEIEAREESFEYLVQRLENLLYDPIPPEDDLDGLRIELHQFVEVFSMDQVDGLEQRFALFTNALSGKISDLSAATGTGITIDKQNPAFPIITQNRPAWDQIQSKPSIQLLSEKNQPYGYAGLEAGGILHINKIPSGVERQSNKGTPNGYPELDVNGKVPVSQTYNQNPSAIIVNNITARNALIPTLTGVTQVWVRDATEDPTVSLEAAGYLWDHPNTTWIKISEAESLDIVLQWANITGKPSTFTPSPHSHSITDITSLQSALDGKRNNGAIDATDITETGDKYFHTFNDKRLWNNETAAGGNISGNVSFSGFNQNRTYEATLTGNTTFTTVSGGTKGNVYVMVFTQDATGGRTITLPSNVKIPSGESIDLAANKISILTMFYNGTNYLGSWKKGW